MGPHAAYGADERRTTLRARTRARIILAGAAVVIVVALVTATTATGPPALCGSCHAMRPYRESLADSGHAGQACVTCHASSVSDSIDMSRRVVFGMIPASLTGRGITGAGEGVADDGCASCHSSGIEAVVDRDGILMAHASCSAADSCVDCHGATAHGGTSRVRRTFTMEQCADCHISSGATLACDACHSPRTQHERLERGPWQVTHGSEWSQTHGLGSLTSCAVCHPPDYCVRCHRTVLPHPPGFGQSHGDEAKTDVFVCTACHDTETFCTPCHTIEMPHPENFLKEHSSVTDAVDDPACSRCHDSEQCVACHVRHVHPGGPQPPKAGE